MKNYDDIQCRVCGKYFKSLTAHIIHKHDMDPDEYKEIFDVGYIVCGSIRMKTSERCRKNPESKYIPKSKKEVIADLKKYAAKQKPLKRSWLYKKDASFTREIYHIFGDLETLERETSIVIEKDEGEEWSQKKILERIRQFNKENIPLHSYAVKQIQAGLVKAARHYFGSWQKAIETAGFDYSDIRKAQRKWSREKIVREIRKLHKQGKPVNTDSIKNNCSGLYYAAGAYIGSWRKAIELAGLDWYEVNRKYKWSKDSIIEEIRKREKQGKTLYHTYTLKEDPSLVRGAGRHFGSWREAVKAAGIDVAKSSKHKKWGKQRIIQCIKGYHAKGVPLRYKEVKRVETGLIGAANYHFGSWGKAVEAAGFSYPKVKKPKKWDKPMVIKAIKRYHKTGRALNHKSVKEAGSSLIGAARRYFGTWEKAVEAAGFDYSKIRKM